MKPFEQALCRFPGDEKRACHTLHTVEKAQMELAMEQFDVPRPDPDARRHLNRFEVFLSEEL
jgi:hypothetical protein